MNETRWCSERIRGAYRRRRGRRAGAGLAERDPSRPRAGLDAVGSMKPSPSPPMVTGLPRPLMMAIKMKSGCHLVGTGTILENAT